MKIVLTDTFCVIWLMINIDIIHGELDWVVNGRVSGYGDNVKLFCLVDDCCKKAAGWIKFDPHYTTIYLDVRDFKHKTSKKDKYAATTNSTGFGLVIKNVRQDDFNIKYLCSYGFEKSSQKVLYQSDVFKVDEPQSKLLLPVVIGSITAVVILLVAIVLIVKWRRKKNLEKNTTAKTHSSLTETVDELSKNDQISQSERLLQKDVATVTVEPSSEDHENNHRTQPEILCQNGEAVIQTAENSSKDNQSTHQPEESQKTVKNLILDLENKSENITYMHEDKENDSKE